MTYRALHGRRAQPGLFSTGEYLPAGAIGAKAEHVCAFLRRQGQQWAAVAVPRLLSGIVPDPGSLPLGEELWDDAAILLPGISPGQGCRNLFTGEVVVAGERSGQAALEVGTVFENFPVAILMGQD